MYVFSFSNVLTFCILLDLLYKRFFCYAAYYQIYGQLKVRLDQKMRQLQINATPASNGGPARPSTAHSNIIDRIESDIGRMRRTIHLLISVGLVFCVCWLPLNIVNTVSIYYKVL